VESEIGIGSTFSFALSVLTTYDRKKTEVLMKPFSKILLLVLAGMGSGAGGLQAQRNEMAIQRLNASDGLAENSAHCML
jgi:hypothetical protein